MTEVLLAIVAGLFALLTAVVGIVWKVLTGRMTELAADIKKVQDTLSNRDQAKDTDLVRLHDRMDRLIEGIHKLEVRIGETFASQADVDRAVAAAMARHEADCTTRHPEKKGMRA